MTISGYINKLKAVTVEIQTAFILKVVVGHSDSIIKLNQQQLFTKGEDSRGEKLQSYTSPSYAEYKLQLNPAGVVDLRLSGAFYLGFFIQGRSFPVSVFSSDIKSKMLVSKYGPIFNLQPENKIILSKECRSEVIAGYREFLALR
jgi:hypothetical protein